MIRLRTISQRLGAFHALVIVLLTGVCAFTLLQLQQMRVDSERLLEEAREQTVLARLDSEITGLQALLMQSTPVDLEELRRGREVLRETVSNMEELEGDEDDPSRAEHQDVEARLSRRLRENLLSVDVMLAQFSHQGAATDVLEQLASAKHYAEVLQAEARSEAREAQRDLRERSKSARAMIIGVLLSALLLLGLAMYMMHRTVVRPLRRLRDSAERFGGGDLGHRVRTDSVDEIGDLAASYNVMADRLSNAQRDLEERVRKRTEEFLRAARLADLGVLASGIAHEINTPLASIATSAEGMQRRLRNGSVPEDVLTGYTDTICQETYRARDITTRMLALVRQDPSTVSDFSLQLILERSESALRPVAEQRGVELVTEAPAADSTLRVNGGELVQILVNLLSNAVDASSRGDRVILRASVENGTLTVDVIDEGEGLRAEDVDRVFEPFFTTKRPGEGTGLGLAIVATMVESHRGHITVESEFGQGCVFHLVVPVDWGVKE